MNRLNLLRLGDRLQNVLLVSFTMIALITFAVGIWTTSVIVNNYTEQAENTEVGRDMDLALAFYERSLVQLEGIASNLSSEPSLPQLVDAIEAGDDDSTDYLRGRLRAALSTIHPAGTHFVFVTNETGDIILAEGITNHTMHAMPAGGNWYEFSVLQDTLNNQQSWASTEIVSANFLAEIGLAEQALIELRDTPKTRPTPYDSREGTAGLAQIACSPFLDADERVGGAVVSGHLFNNDFTLVDRIQSVAGVDTATIFFGDLRVSTNVRENGERATGTRVSEAVFDIVLGNGEPFTGIAYVVNEWFITRYVPLHDHQEQVVGMLYVGARRATFLELQRALNTRIILVTAAAIIPVTLLALPIARVITRPLEEIADASRLVAQGNTGVRVPERGVGETAVLGKAFNSMLADLTEAQARLIRNERLASMGELAAGVAHQLNNPLGTILLFSDILLSELPEQASTREDVEMIAHEAHRAKDIVTALLNFTRQQTVSAEPTDLGPVLQDLIERARQLPKYENVTLVEQIDPDLPHIEIDPAQLPNIFVNLLENAADAMPGGGTLTVKAKASQDRLSVIIQVEDTGTGIPPENVNEIFSPFFTTKPFGQGTGLGLAIVYGIVKRHQGTIRVDSRVGEGSTFTVRLHVHLPVHSQHGTAEEKTIRP